MFYFFTESVGSFLIMCCRLFFTSSNDMSAAGFRAMMTMSTPPGSCSFISWIACLTSRLIRFLVTAFPIFLLTDKPIRNTGWSAFCAAYMTNCRLAIDFPFWNTCWNSLFFLILCSFLNVSPPALHKSSISVLFQHSFSNLVKK